MTKTSTLDPSDPCKACGLTRSSHESPDIRHKFSETGELEAKEQKTPLRVPPGGALAARLALLLAERGIISEDDAAWVISGDPDVSPRRRAERDRSPGAESTP